MENALVFSQSDARNFFMFIINDIIERCCQNLYPQAAKQCSFHCAEANKNLMEVYEMHNPKEMFSIHERTEHFPFGRKFNILSITDEFKFCYVGELSKLFLKAHTSLPD